MSDNLTQTELQSWIEAYIEMAELIVEELGAWVDLWSGQTDVPWEQFPFPIPSVFIGFSTENITDMGDKSQQLLMNVTFYSVYQTYGETFEGGFNREHALGFGKELMKLHQLMHCKSGKHFSDLTRTAIRQRPAAVASLIVYEQTYSCIIVDYSANPKLVPIEITFAKPEVLPSATPPVPFYTLDTNG